MLKKILSFFLLCSLILVLLLSLPWILLYLISFLEPNPPVPKITYGEFPFTLEYKIDDDTFIVEDVLICEYDGIKWNEGTGKNRSWKKYLKNLKTDNVLILTDENMKIFCNIGKAEYYMGDTIYASSSPPIPTLYYVDGHLSSSKKEVLDQYGIQIIDWKFSKPINNSFQ